MTDAELVLFKLETIRDERNIMPPTGKPEYPAFILSALSVVAIVVLILTNHAVPETLNVIATAGLVGGAAITHPFNRTPPPAV